MYFSIKEAFISTFKILKKKSFAVFIFPIICFILKAFTKILAPNIIFEVLDLIIEGMVLLSITNAFLPIFNRHKVKLKNYFPNYKNIFKFFIGEILLVIPVFVSVILGVLGWEYLHANNTIIVTIAIIILLVSIVGTVISTVMIIKYLFFYINLLNGDSFLSSFKNSAKITFGNRNKLFLLFLMISVIELIIEYLPISLFINVITSPLSALIYLNIYEQLLLILNDHQ